jgi:uncharacterized protein
VEKLENLKPGMVLEGVVTNVAAFGAFVDVGVHQDGLVHISAMANAYVKDPRKIAKPGDVVRVKVLEIDPKRRRISLTMRLDEAPENEADSRTRRNQANRGATPPTRQHACRPKQFRARERQCRGRSLSASWVGW